MFCQCCQNSIVRFGNSIWGMMMLSEKICSYPFHVFRTQRKNFWVFGETIWACTSNFNCVNCILNVHKENWRDFVSLKTPGRFCQFRFFGNRSWALLQKKFRPYFQNSIRGDQSSNLRKNKFFKEISFFFRKSRIIFENFSDFWQKKLIGRLIYYDF